VSDKLVQRHFVDVWNPSYASNAMEAHLAVLLHWAAKYDAEQVEEEAIYVWWGKVRSTNRQQPLKHLDAALAIGQELDQDEDREGHLYLTDYRSLYVAHVDRITRDDVRSQHPDHVPQYYTKDLACDFWYRVVDIRRLVADDTLGVIAELKSLRNVDYGDRPVSLYGGMVDLPLIVVRPDGARFFDPVVRDPVTDGTLWAEFDAQSVGLGAMERELRENLFGDGAWMALEPAARTFIATAEKVFRDHRSDAAFDFGPVVGSFSKAVEVTCNSILRGVFGRIPVEARRVNIDGQTVDLGEGRHLTLGEFARVVGGERSLNAVLTKSLKHGAWFTGSLPAIVDDLRQVRNQATHSERVEREVATRWRDRLVGVGGQGILVELARVQPRL
jgi:hypothetical protein